MFRGIQTILLAACVVLLAQFVRASTCDQAASVAAGESGIPEDILRAITRVETGRRRDGVTEPWPWTVNFAGKGHFFDDPAAAIDFVQGLIDQGETVIDVGCFQMNVKYHSRRFQSLEDMFDPVSNARGAADFLGQLQSETGSWEDAVGYYHSRTPKRAAGYAKKVAAVLADLGPALVEDPMLAPLPQTVPRRRMVINYPYLQGGQPAMPGSLVPVAGNTTPLIGG